MTGPAVPPRNPALLAAVLMSSAAAFLLGGYEFVRSPATTLFKEAWGAGSLPAVMAAVPVAVVLGIAAYGRALSALGPRRTLHLTSAVSIALVTACVLAIQAGVREASIALFLVRDVYIVLLVEQYWSFLDSSLAPGSARRFNGPVTGIGSLGALLGGLAVGEVASRVGTTWLPVVGVLLLVPASLVMEVGFRRVGEPAPGDDNRRGAGHLGLAEFRKERVLGLLLAMVVLSQVAGTALDLRFQSSLSLEIPDADAQTAWSGRFFGVLNAASGVLQFVVVPLLMARLSPRALVLTVPLAALASWVVLAVRPSLHTAAFAYLVFKSVDYSVFRAAKELLYIPLPFDARYRAKEVVDAFGYRFGKGAASLGFLAVKPLVAAMDGLCTGAALMAELAWLGLALRVRPTPPAPGTDPARSPPA